MEPSSSSSFPESLLAHAAWVQQLARRLIAADRAEDVAQETWMLAFEHPPRHARNPRSWLAHVARNVARRLGRDESARRKREIAAARPVAAVDTSALVERAAAQRQLVGLVLDLAEPYRSTVLLRFFEDLAPREIAARQGVPVETVRTRLKRALTMLREALDRSGTGGRPHWTALLLPLAVWERTGVAPGLVHAGTTGSLTGVIAMSTSVKITAAVLVVAAASFSLWHLTSETSRDPTSPRRGPGEPSRADGGVYSFEVHCPGFTPGTTEFRATPDLTVTVELHPAAR